MIRFAFICRRGSTAYIAVTHDETGGNLPAFVEGAEVHWSRIEASHGEVFPLLSTADMERDLHEARVHITKTQPVRRDQWLTAEGRGGIGR